MSIELTQPQLADSPPAAGPALPSLALATLPARLAAAVLLVAAVLIVLLVSFTDVDLQLADAYFDAGQAKFPWQHAWLTEVFSHLLLKRVLIVLGLGFIGVALWDRMRPGRCSPLQTVRLRIVALSAVLIPAVTSLVKSFSSSHCPWDLARYGGSAPYIRLLDTFPAGMAPGQCMPGGHASSALWLIALTVFFLPRRPHAAALCFVLTLGLGMALGWLQQMRGAHFLSHTLWSMWIACTVLLVLLQRTRHTGLR